MFTIIHSPYRPDCALPKQMDAPTVLGLNVTTTGTYSHNSSAALVKGNKILSLCEQERMDRIKESGHFPAEAASACLKTAGLTMQDVDAIAVATDPYFVQSRTGTPPEENLFSIIHKRLANYFGNIPKTLILVNHHLSHAASCFYPSGMEKSLIITWDGGGDNQHTVIYQGNDSGIRQLKEYPCSLGNLYNKFRRHLNLSDKGSLMGLASYGKKEPGPLAPFYHAESIAISSSLQFASGGEYIVDPVLLEAVGHCRLPDTPIGKDHIQLAANVQHAVETLCSSIVNKALSLYPARTLCLAGGVALNATFNGILWRSGLFEEIFIQPNAPDGGLSLGAALEAVHIISRRAPRCKKMDHAAFGPCFENDDIERTLRICKVPWEYLNDDELMERVAIWLSEGKVVGWFQGRMEWGPRALGNRSILADPRRSAMADKVNHIIKYRDEWRPFALSILEERADEFLEAPYPDPFMITTSPVKVARRESIAAVVHADGTTRPQFVSPKTMYRYHKLISHFAQKTGVPGLLNTSFNLKGEPIVCSPRDALRTFFSSGLEILVLGNHVVRKQY